MSSTPLFSIALAGYQTAPYLRRALDSITAQTFTDFEVLCYVEESTDGSLEICRAQAAADARFKVISAPRSGGVGTTRNYAIDHAAGEYLVVLDGDDWFFPQLLEKLHGKLRETGTLDVLSFDAVTTPDEEAPLEHAPRLTNFRPSDASGVFTGREALRRAGRNGGQFRAYTWLSAYRVAFLRENRFYQTDGLRMEDFGWTPRVWFAAEKFACLHEVLYVYRRRENSLTTESSSQLVLDLMKQIRLLLEFEEDAAAPEDLRRVWSSQWFSTLYWFLFHPVSSRKISDRDRREALNILLAPPGAARMKRLAALLSAPKRLPLPLIRLAAKGPVWPVRLYFRLFYYPLIALRGGR